MSGVNSQIPLQYNPQPLGPNVGQAVGTANALMQFQNAQQEQQRQNKLRDILGSPGAIDKIGQPTPETMSAVMGVDPNVGLKLQQNALSGGVQRAQLQQMNLKRQEQLFDLAEPVRAAAMAAYSSAPGDEVAKRQAGQRVYTEELNRAFSGGQMSDEEKALANPTFDPVRVGAQSVRWQDMQKQRDLEKHQATQEADTKRRLDIDEKRVTATDADRGMSTGVDADGRPIVLRPGAPAGQPKATYFNDGSPVPDEKLTGAHKMGAEPKPPTEGSSAANREAIAGDVKNDPDFKDKTPGQRAAEVENRFAIASGKLTDPGSREQMAEGIAAYQLAPLSNYALTRPGGPETMALVRKINPDYQETRYPEVNRAMTAFGSGKQGDTIRSLNVATQHLDTIDQAAEALKNGDVRLFNSVGNRIAQEVGAPAPTTFDALKQIVGTEIEKAVAGGIGAVADRDRLMKSLDGANSPAQLEAVSQAFKKLMAGQALGLRQQYEDSTGFKTGPFSFDTKLMPATKKALGMVAGEGGSAPAPADPDVAYLRANPDKAAMFDKHFGAGAAEKILGAKP